MQTVSLKNNQLKMKTEKKKTVLTKNCLPHYVCVCAPSEVQLFSNKVTLAMLSTEPSNVEDSWQVRFPPSVFLFRRRLYDLNCNCFQPCFKISLTITGLNTYTFTIIDQVQSQIAQGTAVLIGNILQLTFSNGCYANIVFENYNIERIGYMSVCGLYIFNGIYQIVPSLCC
jgi:hypothetical protein